MIRDGQVTQGAEIIKLNVQKVYRLRANVIGGSTSSLVTTLLPIQQVGIVILN
jgi:ATP-dependent protease HslVU (ClpYQ) peptidase subunit